MMQIRKADGSTGIRFSPEQKSVLDLRLGRHLVLAPAGTGKTELLSHQVLNFLNSGSAASGIACLTFTNRAARIMQERVSSVYNGEMPFIGNLHRFAFHFLLENEIVPKNLSIFDEEDSHETMTQLLKERSLQIKAYDMLSLCSALKALSLNIPFQLLHNPPRLDRIPAEVQELCVAYEDLKSSLFAADFDDLLYYLHHALQNPKPGWNMLNYMQLQVDEVQDMNALQWDIIEKLGAPGALRIFYGDQEQAIYSFMGARLDNLLRCAAQSRIHRFTTNYRSPCDILPMLNAYLQCNIDPQMIILSESWENAVKSSGRPELVEIRGDGGRQDAWISSRISHEIQGPGKLTAVLVRTNSRADEISRRFSDAGMNHFRISGFDLFRRRSVKDILAWFTAMGSPSDRMAWSRVLWMFVPGISLPEARQLCTELYRTGMYPEEILQDDIAGSSLISTFHNDFLKKRTVIFDTETTGTDTLNDDIIQIAAVICENGAEVKRWSRYLLSDRDLTASAPIHGITRETLNTFGKERKLILSEFAEIIEGAVLAAHNAPFDVEMLKNNFMRAGVSMPAIIAVHDSLQLSRHLYPGLKSYKLSALLDEFGLEGQNTHDAMDDSLAACHLLRYIADSSAEILAQQLSFLSDNKKTFNAFRKRFQPLYDRIKGSLHETFTMRQAVDLLTAYLESLGSTYFRSEERQHLQILLHHMDVATAPAPLREHFKSTVRPYLHYREADLILGDEHVVISTVHKAKGLEFDHVVIPDCNDGVYPFYNHHSNEELQEDARLLYVALSRSRDRLTIIYPTERTTAYGKKISLRMSPFLMDIKQFFKLIKV